MSTSDPKAPLAKTVVKNPRTGETLYTIDEPAAELIAEMQANAREAFEVLGNMSVAERLKELGKLKRYLLENKDHVAERIVEETGKSVTDALMLEIFPALDSIDYYEKNAERFLADQKVKTPIILAGKKSKVCYEPIGPVLIISPWNYPFHLSFIPMICALVAGNPVILKPSSYTPLKGVLEDMVEKSGFLPHAIQVAYATRKSAHHLINGKPAKIFFTGSVGAGKRVMAAAAEHLIPVELELGGKDPMVVFEDVGLERTVSGAVWGGFANCGQTCTSVERILVHESIHDKFVDLLKEKTERLRTLENCENGDEPGAIDVGCMTAEFQIKEVEEQIADAVAKGAKVVVGGAREAGSHVFPPTIITNIDKSMNIFYDETFGPVVTVYPFKTEEEAIALCNDSPFGLSASVWCADLERAQRVAKRIVTGNVSINNVLATQGNSALPFGGVKESGFGRYRGPYGLHSFSNIKSILIDKQGPRAEMIWYPYIQEKHQALRELIDAAFSKGPVALLKTALAGLKLEILNRKNPL